MVYIVGGVISQDFVRVSQLWGAMAFHAVTTGLGTALLGKAIWPNLRTKAQVEA